MKKLADAKDNPNIFKIEQTCTGKGWDQGHRTPCFALWEISAVDIFKRKYTDMAGDTEITYGFLCPECGCFTELNAADLPREVKLHAKEFNSSVAKEILGE